MSTVLQRNVKFDLYFMTNLIQILCWHNAHSTRGERLARLSPLCMATLVKLGQRRRLD